MNEHLERAKIMKNDEFYTRYEDIAAEIEHYPLSTWQGKTVYSNCDDPHKSQFVRYFLDNFNRLGLRRYRATCYGINPTHQHTLESFADATDAEPRRAWHLEVTSVGDDTSLDAVVARDGNSLTVLEGTGSFDSPECIALMQDSDIVVTNPPFSLMTRYVRTVTEDDCKHDRRGGAQVRAFLFVSRVV